jgi:hypothetical protein
VRGADNPQERPARQLAGILRDFMPEQSRDSFHRRVRTSSSQESVRCTSERDARGARRR